MFVDTFNVFDCRLPGVITDLLDPAIRPEDSQLLLDVVFIRKPIATCGFPGAGWSNVDAGIEYLDQRAMRSRSTIQQGLFG